MKTKYPIRIGSVLFDKGTEVRRATLEEMREFWPTIEMKPNSNFVGVFFPGRSVPTVVTLSQLVV